jgi:hypothetical protein
LQVGHRELKADVIDAVYDFAVILREMSVLREAGHATQLTSSMKLSSSSLFVLDFAFGVGCTMDMRIDWDILSGCIG